MSVSKLHTNNYSCSLKTVYFLYQAVIFTKINGSVEMLKLRVSHLYFDVNQALIIRLIKITILSLEPF